MRSLLIATLCLTLAACGNKQPDLAPGQEAQQLPLPELSELSGLDVRWSKRIGDSESQNTALIPYVDEAVIYVASADKRISALDSTTGETLWSARAPGSIDAGVGAGATAVVVGLTNGDVIAYEPLTGERKWEQDLGRIISAPPVVSAQTVVVRTQDGNVFGLRAATGEIIWGLERPIASLSVGRDASSLVAGEGLLTGFSSGRLLANSLDSGQIYWERRAFRPQGKNEIERLIDMDAAPLLAGEAVIVGAYQGGVVAYRIRDGELIWRNDAVSTRQNMFAHGGVLYVTQSNGALSALSLNDGAVLWTQTALIGRGISAPVVYNNQLIVGGLRGNLFALELGTGELLARTILAKPSISSLHLSNLDLLVYSRSNGSLRSLRAQ